MTEFSLVFVHPTSGPTIVTFLAILAVLDHIEQLPHVPIHFDNPVKEKITTIFRRKKLYLIFLYCNNKQ